jgi:pyruvate formate lyase activating enzyme
MGTFVISVGEGLEAEEIRVERETTSHPQPEKKGLIFNIQKFSLHDGPGIRTTVFMKGCPLRCGWCSNPESQSARIDMMMTRSHCIDCNACLDACPKQAIRVEGNGKGKTIDRGLCDRCGVCASVCPSRAIEEIGTPMTVDEIVEEIRKDETFYHHSEGGVTVSGGEPLLQSGFVVALLEACKKHRLHTALDTCGHVPWEILESTLAYVDLVLYDIKSMDSGQHREATGAGNEIILANAVRTAKAKRTWVRYTVVPGFNDSELSARSIGEFASKLRPEKMSLLPYHSFGAGKYERLGRPYPMGNISPPPVERLTHLAGILGSFGLSVTIGY